MLLQVHDELVLEVPKNEIDTTAKIETAKEAVENGMLIKAAYAGCLPDVVSSLASKGHPGNMRPHSSIVVKQTGGSDERNHLEDST